MGSKSSGTKDLNDFVAELSGPESPLETCALHLAGSAPGGAHLTDQARGRRGESEGCWSRPCSSHMPQLNPEAGGPGTNLTHEARPLGPGLPHPHATSLQSYPVFRPLALAKAHGYHTAAESQPGARALPGQRWCPGGSEPRWLLGRRPTPAPACPGPPLCPRLTMTQPSGPGLAVTSSGRGAWAIHVVSSLGASVTWMGRGVTTGKVREPTD